MEFICWTRQFVSEPKEQQQNQAQCLCLSGMRWDVW